MTSTKICSLENKLKKLHDSELDLRLKLFENNLRHLNLLVALKYRELLYFSHTRICLKLELSTNCIK